MYIAFWWTEHQFVRNFVECTADSKRWASREQKIEKAKAIWRHVFDLAWDLDWKRVNKNENGEWEVLFHTSI